METGEAEARRALKEAKLVLCVNSIIGRPGNIGFRFLPVVEHFRLLVARLDVFCRGGPRVPGARVRGMGLLGHASRALNALRIYVYRGLPHRHADVWLFSTFCRILLAGSGRTSGPAVAHVVESSPRLISSLRAKGYHTILEVPIAPLTYMAKLQLRLPDAMPEPLDRAMMHVEAEAIRSADWLICPSEFVAEEVVELGASPDRIHVVPFATKVDDWRRPDESAGNGVRFCFAGNVSHRKGVSFLLAAWARGNFSEDELHLCGRIYPEGRRVIAACGRRNVVAPGFVDAPEYFKRCDVYVLPSLMEGSAKSIYEAMNREMPVITTRESGSIVRDGIDGFIVPAGDAEALLEKMLWLKSNPADLRRMGRAAKARVMDFTEAAYLRRLEQVYIRALTENV